MQDINYIQIGKTRTTLKPRKWISGFMPSNNFFGLSNFDMTNDGTTHYKNVDRYYRPQGDFTFNFSNPQEYSECVQIINGDPFVIRYYDPDILMWVVRQFKMTNRSIGLFLRGYGNDYRGVINHNFKAESIFAYDSYSQLIDKATDDDRF